jgi:hypothetical protein
MSDVIDFKTKQAEAKSVIASILKPESKPPVKSFPFVWGMLEPKAHSQWITCPNCADIMKLTIGIKPLLATIQETIEIIETMGSFPVRREICEGCNQPFGFAIKSVNIEVYPHKQDGTPWDLVSPPKAS